PCRACLRGEVAGAYSVWAGRRDVKLFDEESDVTPEAWRYHMEQRRVLQAEDNRPKHPKQGLDGAGAELRNKAFRRWGTKCPCCGVPMHDRKTVDAQKMTVGHDGSIDAGGAPRWRWIFICHRCNQEQGKHRF